MFYFIFLRTKLVQTSKELLTKLRKHYSMRIVNVQLMLQEAEHVLEDIFEKVEESKVRTLVEELPAVLQQLKMKTGDLQELSQCRIHFDWAGTEKILQLNCKVEFIDTFLCLESLDSEVMILQMSII